MFLALFLLACISCFAQDPFPPDTLTLPIDTTFVSPPDSSVEDSTVKTESDGVDTVVTYSADNIDFDVAKRVSVLTGNAQIRYKNMTLDAGKITVDWNAQLLTAEPVLDTLYADSLLTEIDSIVTIGRPHFVQGADDFFGDEIAYNMKTRKGRVRGGTTMYEQGIYYGEQFKRLSEDVITVKHGRFTTCDADSPHYHFAANRLKIIVGRRVIARPVFLYFDDVPCFAAPYGIFPQQKGRTSGIIVPTFGESSSQGRFLRDVGYYWAPSQFMDVLATIDYFEQFGVLGRGEYRYARRYDLNGSTRFSFDTQRLPGGNHRDYSIATTHNQIIDEFTRLSISGAYVSSASFYENTGSVQDQYNQSVRSNATLNKSFYQSPWSMSANAGFEQNIKIETWSALLPAISVSHRNGLLFPPPKPPQNIRNATAPKEINPPWYRAFNWGYNASYQNSLALPKTLKQEGLKLGTVRLDGTTTAPISILGNDSLSLVQRDGAAHSGGISATAKILRYVSLNPRLNAKHIWTRRVVNYRESGKVLDREDEYGFFTRTTFDVGASAATKLYGTSHRPLGIGASFRHMMTPGVSFTYTPDFSDKEWKYYKTVTLPDGRSYTWDRFAGAEMAGNIGGTPAGLREALGFSLDHLFQMKTGNAEEQTEKRFDLLTVGMQSGMDLKRDSLKWDDLRMSFSSAIPGRLVGPVNGLSFDLSTTHSLYATEEGVRVREFFWERDGANWYAPLELLNTSMNIGFSLQGNTIGEMLYLTPRPRVEETDTTTAALADSIPQPYNPADVLDYRGSIPPAPGQNQGRDARSLLLDLPVSVSVNLRRTKDYRSATSTSSLGANSAFSLTPRWAMNMDYAFDLDRKEVRNASVSVTRDLHCWEASLLWSPLGFRPGYYLRIGLKAPMLRDVKVERHRGAGFSGNY